MSSAESWFPLFSVFSVGAGVSISLATVVLDLMADGGGELLAGAARGTQAALLGLTVEKRDRRRGNTLVAADSRRNPKLIVRMGFEYYRCVVGGWWILKGSGGRKLGNSKTVVISL